MTDVWFTSDGHIGHYTVNKMRLEAFTGWEISDDTAHKQAVIDWHKDFLAERWDSFIKHDDIVYYLGDGSMDGKANAENFLAWVKARPGKKRFVFGNHDPVAFGINRDAAKWVPRYMEAFEWVMPFHRIKVAGRNVLLSHFPYQGGGDHTAIERYGQYRLPFLGEWLLHGHTHSSQIMWSSPEYSGSHRQIHVGVDAWDYNPVPMEEIAAIIEKGETSED